MGVLDGIRVLDFSWGIAGPMTTMLLADNGADVVKVEPPGGDPFRMQSGYRVWQRGKRSAVLDLRSADGRDAVADLIRGADVVVESYAPGTAEQLGVDGARVLELNPAAIHCSITGYGPDGDLSGRPGYDALVAARTGILFDQRGRKGTAMEYIKGRPGPDPEYDAPEGYRRGTDREGPIFPRSTWPSLGAAYQASLGISAALRAREVTGRGQLVETSLLAGALSSVALNWQRVDNPDAELYWMWPVDARSIEGLFECADGRWVHHWVIRPNWVQTVAAGDELAVPDLDHDYRNDPDRLGMGPEDLLVTHFLYPTLVEHFRKFPSAAWEKIGEQSGMGVALVRSPAEALSDPNYLADGCVVRVNDPEVGDIRYAGPLIEFGSQPGEVKSPAPRVGQHTADVLAETPRPRTEIAASGGALPTGPLSGVRVLDLGLGVAGPFNPRLLADLGADVIKVHALHDTFWAGTHMGLGTNRGKRSISLNLKDPRGLEALHKLVATADVVTMNWRPGAAKRLGIDYESLRQRYPRLIFCNTRGYERGPRSAMPGTDQTAAALAGVEWEDGACSTGNPPLWSRSGMGDTGNAFLAAIGIVMALFRRERTGHGEDVSTSIINACLFNTTYAWVHADGTQGDYAQVDAEQYGLGPLYRLYRCADDWVFLAAVKDEHRAALAQLVGVDRLPADAQAQTKLLTDFMAADAAADVWKRLDAAGVPVEVVDEDFCRHFFDDPRFADLVSTTSARGVGTFQDPGILVRLSDTPGGVQRGPALCGQHTREILREIGYADSQVHELAEGRVVLDAAEG